MKSYLKHNWFDEVIESAPKIDGLEVSWNIYYPPEETKEYDENHIEIPKDFLDSISDGYSPLSDVSRGPLKENH